MTISDDDFDDDDDEFLLALPINHQKTSNSIRTSTNNATANITPPSTIKATTKISPEIKINNDVQSKLYRADGEISILKEKNQQLALQRQLDHKNFMEKEKQLQQNNEEQLKVLQFTIQKLEDEKKFLANEIKSLSSLNSSHSINNGSTPLKKRKITTIPSPKLAANHNEVAKTTITNKIPKIIRIQNDSSLLTDHIIQHCINGSSITTMQILSKIYSEIDIEISDFHIQRKRPMYHTIIEFLIIKKNLRLDDLVSEFTETLMKVIQILLNQKNSILAVPFLLSLIHCTINFKPTAVTKKTLKFIIENASQIALNFSFLLDSIENQEISTYHNVPHQVLLLEKFTLICCLDIIEKLIIFSSQYDKDFVNEIWKNYISPDLFKKCLPENSERFKTTAQINLVYNFIEILISTVGEGIVELSNASITSIFNSVLKIFLIDIPLLDDFMVYGLNRVLGNNIDLKKLESTVRTNEKFSEIPIISVPCPLPYELLQETSQNETLNFQLLSNHEIHLLNLRVRVAQFMETFILSSGTSKHLESKDHIKSMIRIIGFEQAAIIRGPRSKYIHLRTTIISILVRIIYYVVADSKGISTLVYPETIYEIFVCLSKIAFGSNSLSNEATALLKLRTNHPNAPIFNEFCERKARQLNHIEHCKNGAIIAETESQFANGLEFPYDEETVEIAREILDSCVTHDEADNLYFNMNSDSLKETDLMDIEM